MKGVPGREQVDDALAAAPDPERAAVAFSRVGEDPEAGGLLTSAAILPAAARLLGYSSAAADFLVAHPDEVGALGDIAPRGRGVLDEELRVDADVHGLEAGLRRFRRRAMMRVAARDLGGGGAFENIVGEISAIASACLELATTEAVPGGGFVVIGLGKLGGAELNYSSDVDLLFVHDGSGPGRQTQMGSAAARVIRSLAEPTAEGIALRVDPTLRPGGRGGALSRSLEGTLTYYEQEAATWERQAMIKARPVAGDRALGDAFIAGVAPFVYPDELAPAAIDEVRQTKVRLEEYIRARGKASIEVKRGHGGIRDVEFAVQLLQLVHGRRDERLREPNTLSALATLAAEGYVAMEDAERLADAYRFLRTLEHRLQIVRDLQTHDLPSDPATLRVLARSLGMGAPEVLTAEYERRTALVRGLHEQLFYRPLLEAFAGASVPRPGIERVPTEELLSSLGFRGPAVAFRSLEELVDPSVRMGKVLSHVFPVIAPVLAMAADPDAALRRFQRIIASVAADDRFADDLARDPSSVRRLAHVAGASSFGTDLLAADAGRIRAVALQAGEDPAARLVGVVAAYAARELDVPAVGRSLAEIADDVITSALADASPGLPFAVIGFGKLGARELNFASDLDVMFVYEGEGAADLGRAREVAEAVLAGIRAAGWEPDADLRPEGRSGPLARSLTSYLEYWQRWAETWEFQALLRGRAIAGDEGLGRRFESNAADLAYPEVLPVERAAEILRMRGRIENERVKPAEARRFHFKLGHGGLADVQFAVEVSLMRHGGHLPEIRARGTLAAIEAMAAAHVLEDGVAHALARAFVFLTDVKDASEMDRRIPAEALPASPDQQTALARRLGYEEYPRQSFLEDYLRITQRSRRAMERVFADLEEADGGPTPAPAP